MSSLGRAVEKKILEQLTKKAAAYTPAEVYLALCTVVPSSSNTGATITEATYTGYARLKVQEGNWKSAEEGAPSKIVNESKMEFAACTGSTSKIKAVALCDSKETSKGALIAWTEVTEFEVSTSSTPAEFAAGELQFTLS